MAIQSVRAAGISVDHGRIDPETRVAPHSHPYDSLVYTLHGSNRVRWGVNLEHVVEVGAGDILHIPAGIVHAPETGVGQEAEYLLLRASEIEIIDPVA